jgi:hypothetical protein
VAGCRPPGEAEGPVYFADSAMPQLAHQRDGLQPAKHFSILFLFLRLMAWSACRVVCASMAFPPPCVWFCARAVITARNLRLSCTRTSGLSQRIRYVRVPSSAPLWFFSKTWPALCSQNLGFGSHLFQSAIRLRFTSKGCRMFVFDAQGCGTSCSLINNYTAYIPARCSRNLPSLFKRGLNCREG